MRRRAVGLMALSGASISTAVGAAPHSPSCPPPARRRAPPGAVAGSQRRLQQPGAMRDHLDRHPGGRGQARLADHPGEQVLRRDLHRPQPEQLPVADAAPAGSAADQLLRHRPLQHGQLHLAGVRPVPVLRRPGRLLDHGQHDEQQQRDHHHRHGRHRHRHRPHDRRLAAPTPTPPNATALRQRQLRPAPGARRRRRRARRTTAASTRPTWRRCSTSSTRPASPGRPTPRTSAAPSRSDRRPT